MLLLWAGGERAALLAFRPRPLPRQPAGAGLRPLLALSSEAVSGLAAIYLQEALLWVCKQMGSITATRRRPDWQDFAESELCTEDVNVMTLLFEPALS